jgi:hypothetical protein
MDFDRAELYQPVKHPVGHALARVRTPDQVASFVTSYGLLRRVAGNPPLQVDRLPVTEFLKEAEHLTDIMRVHVTVRSAIAGDGAALAAMRARFGEQAKATDDRGLLLYASAWVAWALNLRLQQTYGRVYDRAAHDGESVPPGSLRVGVLPQTLQHVCYLQVALALAEKEPIAICIECDRPFVVEDARQRFCTPQCSNRARFRRHHEKHSNPAVKRRRVAKAARPR